MMVSILGRKSSSITAELSVLQVKTHGMKIVNYYSI